MRKCIYLWIQLWPCPLCLPKKVLIPLIYLSCDCKIYVLSSPKVLFSFPLIKHFPSNFFFPTFIILCSKNLASVIFIFGKLHMFSFWLIISLSFYTENSWQEVFSLVFSKGEAMWITAGSTELSSRVPEENIMTIFNIYLYLVSLNIYFTDISYVILAL